MTFGQRLKETRESLAITQIKLAKMTNSSKSRIWELEKYENANPTMQMLKGISSSLGRSIDYFVFGEHSQEYDILENTWEQLNEDEKDKIMDLMAMWAERRRLKK